MIKISTADKWFILGVIAMLLGCRQDIRAHRRVLPETIYLLFSGPFGLVGALLIEREHYQKMQELKKIEDLIAKYRDDPVYFAENIMGILVPQWQKAFLRSLHSDKPGKTSNSTRPQTGNRELK